MTWTLDTSTGEVTAPWGDVVATIDAPYQTPGDVQQIAEAMFRAESMGYMSTDRIADFAQAWMGDIEVVDR